MAIVMNLNETIPILLKVRTSAPATEVMFGVFQCENFNKLLSMIDLSRK